MSTIDLSNPKVLKNYLTEQAKEGKGDFYVKEKVTIFRNYDGLEFMVPDGVPLVQTEPLETQPVEQESNDSGNPEKELEELRAQAKAKGIKAAHFMGKDTLLKKLNE